MASPQEQLTALTAFLDRSIDNFSGDIPDLQNAVFRRVQILLKDLDLRRGSVRATAANLRKINRIKREIERLVLNPRYLKEINTFTEAFNKGSELQTAYFATVKEGFTTPKFIDTLRQASIDNTKIALTEAGIRANVVDKAGEIIQRNITESASFSDLVDDMRNFLTETPESVGALKRYTSQIVTDSLNTYSAEYNRFVSDSLNLQWHIYTGSLVKDSREFCKSLIKKKWVHKSEFGAVAQGNFIPKPKDLKGLKPGTNADNLQIFRGGFNCRHLLTPIAEEFVPERLVNKFN